MHHGAKAPWIVQPQRAAAGLQLKMVVHPAGRQRRRKLQAARHAQVQQQQTPIQVQQQVFATPRDTAHVLPDQCLGRTAQRPAQRLAHLHPQHPGTRDAIGKTAASDFNFGQFGHGARCFFRWIPERFKGLRIRPRTDPPFHYHERMVRLEVASVAELFSNSQDSFPL
ncbi:hypothetical protein D9M68_860560 [compost metagenome]